MDEKIYKGKIYSLKIKQYNKAMNRLKILRNKSYDLSPILLQTVEAFKKNMQSNFLAKQSPDDIPIRWAALSPKYAYIKYKSKARRIANLIGIGVNGGRLKKAVFGGPGWYQTILGNRVEYGIVGIPYSARHNFGDRIRIRGALMPQRAYFTRTDGKLPTAVINYLVGKIEQAFNGEL